MRLPNAACRSRTGFRSPSAARSRIFCASSRIFEFSIGEGSIVSASSSAFAIMEMDCSPNDGPPNCALSSSLISHRLSEFVRTTLSGRAPAGGGAPRDEPGRGGCKNRSNARIALSGKTSCKENPMASRNFIARRPEKKPSKYQSSIALSQFFATAEPAKLL